MPRMKVEGIAHKVENPEPKPVEKPAAPASPTPAADAAPPAVPFRVDHAVQSKRYRVLNHAFLLVGAHAVHFRPGMEVTDLAHDIDALQRGGLMLQEISK